MEMKICEYVIDVSYGCGRTKQSNMILSKSPIIKTQVLCIQKPKKIFLLQQDNKRCSDYFIMKMTEGTTLDLTRKEVDLKPLLLEDQNHHERPTEF